MKVIIPVFPEFIPVNMEHKQIFEVYFKQSSPVVSEYNFTEIFGWRKVYNTKVTKLRENLCVFIDKEKERIFFPPFGNSEICDTVKDLLSWQKAKSINGVIYGVQDWMAKELSGSCQEFVIEKDRDNADYVYCTKDLVNLRGKKYDGKRNQIKRFVKNYTFEYMNMSEPLVPECIEFQKRWCEMNLCRKGNPLFDENLAILEMLNNYSGLEVFGGVLKIDSRVEAFVIAGELNPETAVVHIEKANINFRGIYQAINQMFCENALQKYKYVNREQDVGDAGLRKAKLSYHPHHMVNKYSITLKIEKEKI